MKQTLLLMVLALGMCNINATAQKKEHRVEMDGFEWYELSKYDESPTLHGAQDKYGNTIVPLYEWDYISYFDGAFFLHKDMKTGIVDKRGNFIVPIEYDEAIVLNGDNFPIPYINVKKGEFEGIYNTYGKCIIPVNRGYNNIGLYGGENGESCAHYRCEYRHITSNSNTKFTFCDASGKEVFTTTRSYRDCCLFRDKVSGKYALAVYESGHWRFVDRNEKPLWNPHAINIKDRSWPIKIQTVKNGSFRSLTQGELSRILFRADWLDNNSEYFAHASEYHPKERGNNYTSNSSSSFSSSSSSSSGSSSSNSGGGTTTVVVEQHGPVQVWIACGGCQLEPGRCTYCHGSRWGYNGRLCSRCGGNGKCTICGGTGGHYETQYR